MHKTSKATFVLPTPLLDELRRFVKAGLADSTSSLVRQSLEIRVAQLREELLAREFEEAAADPLFMIDLQECMKDFDGLAGEGLDGRVAVGTFRG